MPSLLECLQCSTLWHVRIIRLASMLEFNQTDLRMRPHEPRLTPTVIQVSIPKDLLRASSVAHLQRISQVLCSAALSQYPGTA